MPVSIVTPNSQNAGYITEAAIEPASPTCRNQRRIQGLIYQELEGHGHRKIWIIP